MANPMYGQNKKDSNVDAVTANYLDYLAGYIGNLSLGGVTIDETASAAVVAGGATTAEIAVCTLRNGCINFNTAVSTGAGGIYLPQAVKDSYLAMEIVGDWDEATAQTIFTRGAVNAGTDVVFAKGVVGVPNGATGTSIETLGTATVPTSIKLIWTPAAANTNQWGPGTMLYFYAPVADIWLCKVDPISEGSGATGALTTSAS